MTNLLFVACFHFISPEVNRMEYTYIYGNFCELLFTVDRDKEEPFSVMKRGKGRANEKLKNQDIFISSKSEN